MGKQESAITSIFLVGKTEAQKDAIFVPKLCSLPACESQKLHVEKSSMWYPVCMVCYVGALGFSGEVLLSGACCQMMPPASIFFAVPLLLLCLRAGPASTHVSTCPTGSASWEAVSELAGTERRGDMDFFWSSFVPLEKTLCKVMAPQMQVRVSPSAWGKGRSERL